MSKKYTLDCLLIEDDYAFALNTRIRLEEFGLNVVATVRTFKEIDDALIKYSVDVILSDVKLNDEEYMYDYLETRSNLPPVILFSGLNSMDIYEKSRGSQPYIFLVKPFDDITLKSAIDGAMNTERRLRDISRDISQNKTLYVKSDGNLVSIETDDILFIKSDGNYCVIFTTEKKIVIRSSFHKMIESINLPHFFQIHRSYIANMNHVTELLISENLLVLRDYELPVGRKFKKSLIKYLN